MNIVFLVEGSAPYSLRDKNELCSRNPKTVTYGTESILSLAPEIWSAVPQKQKKCESLDSFKKYKEIKVNSSIRRLTVIVSGLIALINALGVCLIFYVF